MSTLEAEAECFDSVEAVVADVARAVPWSWPTTRTAKTRATSSSRSTV
jgi:hypothetical protein